MADAVPVWWASLHAPDVIARGYWDTEVVEALTSGSWWRPPGLPRFEHYEGADGPPEAAEGALVVVPARWHDSPADVAAINARLARLRWAVVFLCGDEESAFPADAVVHPNARVWRQTPPPGDERSGRRPLGDGPPPRCRDLLAGMGDEAAVRRLGWFFHGQVNNPVREACRDALQRRQLERGDGLAGFTRAFGSGIAYDEYLRRMATAKVAPCPSGCYSADSFRLFEALEAGALPIVDAAAPRGVAGYWETLCEGPPPWPVVDDWAEADVAISRALLGWPANATRAAAWWQGEKRRMAHRLVGDLQAVGAVEGEPAGVEDEVTALVTVSPIPEHPGMATLEETLASIRDRLGDCEVVVACDGVRPEMEHRRAAYEEHLRALVWACQHRWHNVVPVILDRHEHQAGAARRALELVRTPLVLFVEADTPLVGDVPWLALAAAVRSGEANVVRLYHEAEVHPAHRHLMVDAEPTVVEGAPLLRTAQWSQRPHLASTAFYRRLLAMVGPDACTFVEDAVYGIVVTAWLEHGLDGWDDWRVWLYAPAGDIKRSTHLDGRGGDPKAGCRFAFVDPPEGAPTSLASDR